PSGWTVTVNPNNGTVTAWPLDKADPGTKEDSVEIVACPVGYEDNTTTNVRVVQNDAQENIPGDNGGSTKPAVCVNIPESRSQHLPPTTRFEILQGGASSGWTVTVIPNTGTVTAPPPAHAELATRVVIPVTVTYPAGSVYNFSTIVSAVPSSAPS
ncbi:hypothetical protein DOS77_10050, partial [Staphylococcus felis]|uniref:YPDG domain-containing protein n=1 Tax=Staphylococcus felis TaxID=46127 RepID=UPI000E3B2D70